VKTKETKNSLAEGGSLSQATAFRRWKDAFKKRSLSSIIEDGIGSAMDGALVCHLAADEKWMELERKGDEAMEALRAISKNPELPQELRDKIYHHAFELQDAFEGARIQAAEAMFNLLVGYFLPMVPYPFAGLDLFSDKAERKGGAS
jgi:phosphoribosyl-ATP pyrophosphohydrolase